MFWGCPSMCVFMHVWAKAFSDQLAVDFWFAVLVHVSFCLSTGIKAPGD